MISYYASTLNDCVYHKAFENSCRISPEGCVSPFSFPIVPFLPSFLSHDFLLLLLFPMQQTATPLIFSSSSPEKKPFRRQQISPQPPREKRNKSPKADFTSFRFPVSLPPFKLPKSATCLLLFAPNVTSPPSCLHNITRKGPCVTTCLNTMRADDL